MANPGLTSNSASQQVGKASKASKNSSARFRQRKISVRQSLAVLWQRDIPDLEDEQQRELQKIDTGVEKAEEEEHHLKRAIDASLAASAGEKVAQVYIPTPDAKTIWPEYPKYYKGRFAVPSSYIRTSATVEDTSGCPYCMDEEDEKFLKQMNTGAKVACSEDEFEMISYKFESVVSQKQPFLTMDPMQIMPFDELSPIIERELSEYEKDPSERLLVNLIKRTSNRSHLHQFESLQDNDMVDAADLKDDDVKQSSSRRVVNGTKSNGTSIANGAKEKDHVSKVADGGPTKDKNKKSVEENNNNNKIKQENSDFETNNIIQQSKLYTPASLYTPLFKASNSRSLIESFRLFGQKIYDHWRSRKIARGGKPIFPILKFEENTERDDNDPYVCFRRREARQARKTRRTDTQSTERLRRLQSEMQTALKLMQMVVKRETMRREALKLERDVFEKRCQVKVVKRKLGIAGDDEDLVTHKKKKVEEKKPARKSQANQQAGAGAGAAKALAKDKAEAAATGAGATAGAHPIPSNVRLPASKIPDMDLTSLDQINKDKEDALRRAIDKQMESRLQADKGWINYTENPFVPYADYFKPPRTGELDIIDARHAAYSSIASSYPVRAEDAHQYPLRLPLSASLGKNYSSRVEVRPVMLHSHINPESGSIDVVSKLGEKEVAEQLGTVKLPRQSCVSLRRRMGRGGRVMIDRRGLLRGVEEKVRDDVETTSDPMTQRLLDRYKYDNESNMDQMEYACSDPSRLNNVSDDTQSMRFGSMLLAKAYDTYKQAYQLRQQHLISLQQKALQMQKAQVQSQQQQQQQQVQHQQQLQTQRPPAMGPHAGAPGVANVNANGLPRNGVQLQPQQRPRQPPAIGNGNMEHGQQANNRNSPLAANGRVVNVPKVEATG